MSRDSPFSPLVTLVCNLPSADYYSHLLCFRYNFLFRSLALSSNRLFLYFSNYRYGFPNTDCPQVGNSGLDITFLYNHFPICVRLFSPWKWLFPSVSPLSSGSLYLLPPTLDPLPEAGSVWTLDCAGDPLSLISCISVLLKVTGGDGG